MHPMFALWHTRSFANMLRCPCLNYACTSEQHNGKAKPVSPNAISTILICPSLLYVQDGNWILRNSISILTRYSACDWIDIDSTRNLKAYFVIFANININKGGINTLKVIIGGFTILWVSYPRWFMIYGYVIIGEFTILWVQRFDNPPMVI